MLASLLDERQFLHVVLNDSYTWVVVCLQASRQWNYFMDEVAFKDHVSQAYIVLLWEISFAASVLMKTEYKKTTLTTQKKKILEQE